MDCNRAHARSRMRAAGEHHAKKHTHNLTCTRACFLPRITATSLAYVSLRATRLYTSKSRNNFNVTSLVCTSHSVEGFSQGFTTRATLRLRSHSTLVASTRAHASSTHKHAAIPTRYTEAHVHMPNVFIPRKRLAACRLFPSPSPATCPNTNLLVDPLDRALPSHRPVWGLDGS